MVYKINTSEPVDVNVAVSGPAGVVKKKLTLNPKQIFQYRFTEKPGTYTVTADAWPIGKAYSNPANNNKSAQVHILKMPPPQTGPKDSKIHVELALFF